MGTAYFSNTVGTILGAALTGFFIVPFIGIQKTLILGAVINAGIGIVTFLAQRGESRSNKRLIGAGVSLALVLLAGVFVKPWNTSLIASDTAVNPSRIAGVSKEKFLNSFRDREILFYKEGLSATVSVARVKDNVSLAVNGKVDASNNDAFTQYLLGHLPLLIHDNPKKVAVIGLGSGSTLAAVAAHPAVETIDGVELEKAVVEASRFFPDLNRNVLKDPRVHMFVNDGRNFLLVRPDLYDVIISEPSNPWMAGVANLFSLEHFKTMRSRLQPDGIACQWLHAYSMSSSDLGMIIKTFTEAFPYVQLWTSYYPDLMLVGYNAPRSIDFSLVKKRFEENAVVRSDLAPHGIRTPEALFSSFWLDDAQLRRLSQRSELHSDNLPRLEFSAPRSLYTKTFDRNYMFLNALRQYDYGVVKIDPPAASNLRFYQEVAEGLLAKRMYHDVDEVLKIAKGIDPENARTLALSGILKLRLEGFEEAEKELTAAVAADPSLAEAHAALYQIYMRTKNYPRALEESAKALAIEPDYVVYQEIQAEALYSNEKWAEALPLFDKVLAFKKSSFDAMTRIVDITMKTGSDQEKIAVLERMAEMYPRYPLIFLQLGQIYEQLNRLPEALEEFEILARLVPEDPSVYLNLARVYDRLGMPAQMVDAVKRAVKQNPSLANHPELRKILMR